MSDLCLLPGGVARETPEPPAKTEVSSKLHLKVATAGASPQQPPHLSACASLERKMPRYIAMEMWEGRATFAEPSSPLARQSTSTQC